MFLFLWTICSEALYSLPYQTRPVYVEIESAFFSILNLKFLTTNTVFHRIDTNDDHLHLLNFHVINSYIYLNIYCYIYIYIYIYI